MGLEADKITFEQFEQQLRGALVHLYDPAYQPDETVWTALGCDSRHGLKSLWSALADAIADLKPEPDVPRSARMWRIYDILACRYVQGLTQEQAAQRFAVSPRHLRREQQQAVGVLARRLWEERRSQQALDKAIAVAEETPLPEETAPAGEWLLQVRQELAALELSAPGVVAQVVEAMHGVLELSKALLAGHAISLRVEVTQPDLAVALHASALRQILVVGIAKLVQVMSSGEIIVAADRHGQDVLITITGQPVLADNPPKSDLIHEIVTTHGGALDIRLADRRASFEVQLPAADQMTVLVVDDNAGLVHFMQRYVTGTRYHLVHLAEGHRAFETIEAVAPDLIVLDVMLPDMDGWELLTQLKAHPDTSDIPVIVCSVVRQEALAMALGAARYLQKPVGRRQFIEALDGVSAGLQQTGG